MEQMIIQLISGAVGGDIMGMITQVAGGGAILTAIIGTVKSKMGNS